MIKKILVTGGAGFIGSNLVRHLVVDHGCTVLNVDKLTYAGNPNSLSDLAGNPRYLFSQTDLCNPIAISELIRNYRPDAIMHLAAESHVDRSIDGPGEFIQTNVVGTFNLLQGALGYWRDTPKIESDFRFLHVSTDEVYGSLSTSDPAFTEDKAYDPHSPYSASKAASDHLVRAWHDTYGLPIMITNCSNNYGPYQFPEKLIPVVILKALKRESIPVYGKGENIRDWLYVKDHARALYTVLTQGKVGETYNIGGDNEMRNIDLVCLLCDILDEYLSGEAGKPARFRELISFVKDRPGHDHRYAINAGKIRSELGWKPEDDADSGFRKTVRWYLDNRDWWESILNADYQMERLGTASSPKTTIN